MIDTGRVRFSFSFSTALWMFHCDQMRTAKGSNRISVWLTAPQEAPAKGAVSELGCEYYI